MPIERRRSSRSPERSVAFRFAGVTHRVAEYRRSAVVFAQGSACAEVMYLQQGSVKLSVLSSGGKEAIVSVLQPGDFFREGCLAGQHAHIATAVALNASTVVVNERKHMFEVLHKHPELNEQFLEHMLKRNIRIEEDLIDPLFNSVEKRLARTLLLLARYGTGRRRSAANCSETVTGGPRRNRWHDSGARQLLHEQISADGVHRLQRRNQSQTDAAERRAPSVMTAPL